MSGVQLMNKIHFTKNNLRSVIASVTYRVTNNYDLAIKLSNLTEDIRVDGHNLFFQNGRKASLIDAALSFEHPNIEESKLVDEWISENSLDPKRDFLQGEGVLEDFKTVKLILENPESIPLSTINIINVLYNGVYKEYQKKYKDLTESAQKSLEELKEQNKHIEKYNKALEEIKKEQSLNKRVLEIQMETVRSEKKLENDKIKHNVELAKMQREAERVKLNLEKQAQIDKIADEKRAIEEKEAAEKRQAKAEQELLAYKRDTAIRQQIERQNSLKADFSKFIEYFTSISCKFINTGIFFRMENFQRDFKDFTKFYVIFDDLIDTPIVEYFELDNITYTYNELVNIFHNHVVNLTSKEYFEKFVVGKEVKFSKIGQIYELGKLLYIREDAFIFYTGQRGNLSKNDCNLLEIPYNENLIITYDDEDFLKPKDYSIFKSNDRTQFVEEFSKETYVFKEEYVKINPNNLVSFKEKEEVLIPIPETKKISENFDDLEYLLPGKLLPYKMPTMPKIDNPFDRNRNLEREFFDTLGNILEEFDDDFFN